MVTRDPTGVLIIGAGPFGLSLAAYLKQHGIDHRIAGTPMGFWQDQMPRGMLLRSGLDWHLDAMEEKTLEAFVAERGLQPEDVEPISLAFYLEYVRWFQEQHGLEPEPLRITKLAAGLGGGFEATYDGGVIEAKNVVVATGFRDFIHVPPELAAVLPEGSYGHTCDVVDLEAMAGKRVVIVGGRQSAFEWAALLADAGAASVDLTYRHDTPSFEPSDWSWVGGLMSRTEVEPGWYRRLPDREREELGRRFWAEGRLKLEPWLKQRIDKPFVRTWPHTRIVAGELLDDGSVEIGLDNGEHLTCDTVILATGYRVDLARVPFLAAGDLLQKIERVNGAPALGEDMQSSVPGLYFTSMAATQDFGPFFAFTVSVKCSTKLIGESLASKLSPATA